MKKGPQINGNKTSSNVIRGLVRDHAMLTDYTLPQVQPFHTKEWRHFMKTNMMRSIYLKPDTHAPIYLSGFAIVIIFGATLFKYYYLGQKSGVLMYNGNVRVKGRAYAAHDINLNPDDYFDSIRGCWKSDPLCGLDTLPKRPWQTFKNPQSVMWRLNWDMKKNVHKISGNGYY